MKRRHIILENWLDDFLEDQARGQGTVSELLRFYLYFAIVGIAVLNGFKSKFNVLTALKIIKKAVSGGRKALRELEKEIEYEAHRSITWRYDNNKIIRVPKAKQ